MKVGILLLAIVCLLQPSRGCAHQEPNPPLSWPSK